MKVAVCVQEKTGETMVDDRFGRCRYYAVVETDGREINFLPNEAAQEQGAGVKAARFLLKTGVQAVVVGNIGPKAYEILTKAGITVYGGLTGDLPTTLNQLEQGQLSKMLEANG